MAKFRPSRSRPIRRSEPGRGPARRARKATDSEARPTPCETFVRGRAQAVERAAPADGEPVLRIANPSTTYLLRRNRSGGFWKRPGPAFSLLSRSPVRCLGAGLVKAGAVSISAGSRPSPSNPGDPSRGWSAGSTRALERSGVVHTRKIKRRAGDEVGDAHIDRPAPLSIYPNPLQAVVARIAAGILPDHNWSAVAAVSTWSGAAS